jgi:modulator of FtsH protease
LHVPLSIYQRGATIDARVKVDRPMAFDIEAWSDFGVALVGAAAALTGLLFVAVSINSAWFSSSASHRGRAGQALVLFVVPLMTGILLVIPGQTTTALGIEIAVCGLLVSWVFLMLGSAKVKDDPRAIVLIDRASPRGLISLALIACGVSLVAGHFGGLYWLAGAQVGALLFGLLNSWVFLLVAGAHHDD